MTTVIKRNTTVPTKKIIRHTTHSDNQPHIVIRVFEGEYSMTNDNYLLGVLELSEIPPAPRGIPQMRVMFDIDGNNVLDVSITDMSTGHETKMPIMDYKYGLSREDIERMILDAEKFQNDDDIQRECVTVKLSLEWYCFNTKERITDEKLAYRINAHQRKIMIEKIKEVHEWMKTNQVKFYYIYWRLFIYSIFSVC